MVRWVQEPLRLLERGQVDQLCACITALATAPAGRGGTADQAATTAAFFTDRAAQVAYPTFLAAGYQIGSGLAESACKRFGTDRMKQYLRQNGSGTREAFVVPLGYQDNHNEGATKAYGRYCTIISLPGSRAEPYAQSPVQSDYGGPADHDGAGDHARSSALGGRGGQLAHRAALLCDHPAVGEPLLGLLSDAPL